MAASVLSFGVEPFEEVNGCGTNIVSLAVTYTRSLL